MPRRSEREQLKAKMLEVCFLNKDLETLRKNSMGFTKEFEFIENLTNEVQGLVDSMSSSEN
ncbi:hypothetical protein H072_9886 [Dactylellina haptotyla CBS 200.50]|uniref:Uncharacterized protein n=1 Tax=Dactylellina haptotyla (strain CBS 200.50) TaxID=1284197 RepID=S8BBK7_DACHA|nr:hypothetical protein H072_9886 [Dactylellina haptotyla CBS 200.50]